MYIFDEFIMLNEFDGSEKRRDQRVKDDKQVSFSPFPEQPEPGDPTVCHALIQDISLGGLKVQCPDFVAVNTPVKINLALAESHHYLNLHGKVRWVRRLAAGESYEVGLQFEDISPQNIQHLLEHLFGN
jgi:c-di-GMP-binding flagellar brake protein YcgR